MTKYNKDDENEYYYTKLLIKIIVIGLFIFILYKFRKNLLEYITSLYRRFRTASSLNMNRQRNIDEQRRRLLEDIDREFGDREFEDREIEDLNIPALAAAATLSSGYARNRSRRIQQDDNERTLQQGNLRRSGRVSNWLGPVNERIYNERRASTTRDLDLIKQKEKEDRSAVIEKTGGYTIEHLKNWITKKGWKLPDNNYKQDYWDLVLGRTTPELISRPRTPFFVEEPSSLPLVGVETLDSMYTQTGDNPSDYLYQPSRTPSGAGSSSLQRLEFGRRKKIYGLY
jgi:hypothetical protein